MIFGNVPIKPEEIVDFLKERVEKKATDYMKQDAIPEIPAWTKAVKDTLAELAYKYGGRPLSTKSQIPRTPRVREFLLDFVWWENEGTGTSGRAIMGVECEWASWYKNNEARANEVAYDFEKLLSFKAPLKLLIFECVDQEGRRLLHKRLCDYLSTFSQHVKGECYLFVEFSRGQCYADTYEVKQDGAVSNVELERLP